ncbi:MAG: response regulator [bacterium]|nr:response regulator [bacterium]
MKEKILIVDYMENHISSVSEILEESKQEYEITVANCSESALEIFQKEKNSFKVILLNLDQADIFGIKLLNKLKETNYRTEVVTYTIEDNIQACVDAMQAGAHDYFSLPFDPEGLRITIEKAYESYNIVKEIEDKSGHQLLNEHPAKNRLDSIQQYTAKKAIEGHIVSPYEFFGLLYAEEKKDEIYPGFSKQIRHMVELNETNKKPAILVIDDNEEALRSYKIILRNKAEAHYTKCAKEGLDQAKKIKELDIILLDIMMPDKNGDVILPELQKLHPEAEIIVITAYQITEIASKVLRMGACGYINKPFFDHTLKAAMSKALRAKLWKQILVELNQKPAPDNPFPFKQRIFLFEDYYLSRIEAGYKVTFCELYYFFPALEGAKPENMYLPNDIKKGDMLFWLANNTAVKNVALERHVE